MAWILDRAKQSARDAVARSLTNDRTCLNGSLDEIGRLIAHINFIAGDSLSGQPGGWQRNCEAANNECRMALAQIEAAIGYINALKCEVFVSE
jgi:hypothetical protein